MSLTNNELPPDLAQIASEAKAIEPPPVVPGDDGLPVEQAEPINYDIDAKGIVDVAFSAIGAFYPSTEKVVTEQKRTEIALALAPVMKKYGLSLGSMFEKYGAEIQLLFVASTIAIPLSKAIAEDREAARLAKDKKAEQ